MATVAKKEEKEYKVLDNCFLYFEVQGLLKKKPSKEQQK